MSCDGHNQLVTAAGKVQVLQPGQRQGDGQQEAVAVALDRDELRDVQQVKTMQKVYGKRIIIMGGGAQVGQVAIGAISEADRLARAANRTRSIDGLPVRVQTRVPS